MDIKSFGKSLYINDDCLNQLQKIIEENKKVQCIIVDPPYGINHKSNRRKDKSDMTTRKGIKNDKNNKELLEKAIELSYKCLSDNSHIYWFTKWTELEKQIPMLRKYYNIKNVLIWDKGNRGSGDLTGAYGNRYECIIFGVKGKRQLNEINGTKRHDDILCYSKIPAKKLIHPHQKPIELLKFLILKSTNKGDTILDMFGGVGSTLIAAEETERNAICIELDDEIYKKGISYIENCLNGDAE